MAKLQTVSGTTGKETIYVDVDDEITAIIDKVSEAKGKVVALVLPKRCPVLQSVVNMKLLKRTADNAKKNLVLITGEPSLLPLAANVGLYVASTPTSKPAIPEVSSADDSTDEMPLKIVDGTADDADEAGGGDFDPKAAGATTIGALDSASKSGKSGSKSAGGDGTIDMSQEADETPLAAVTAKLPKPKKDKKLHVPNFDSFRKRAALGALGLIVLVALYILAAIVLPAATVTIATDSSTIPTNLTLTLDTSAHKLNTSNNTVPAIAQSQQKNSSQQVNATGQQNNGTKATGSVKLTTQACAPNINTPPSVPVGSSVTSGGHTFITQQTATYGITGGNGSCANYSTGSVDIAALKAGTAYNVDNASFSGPNGASGSGSASGGTDNIVTVVQQSDIDGAVSKIASDSSSSVKQTLKSDLESKGLMAIDATFVAGTPQTTTSAQVGDQASSVTVTSVTTYTMLGVQKSDLQTLVHNNVDGQLKKGVQVVLDDGVDNAQFAENTQGNATSAQVAMSVKSQVGPQIDSNDLKKQIAGMKSGDVKSTIKEIPGVTDVQVHYSPFWVNTVPKKATKVTIKTIKAGS